MKRRTVITAVLTLPLIGIPALAGTARPKQLTGWREVTSRRLDPVATHVEILPPQRSWNMHAVRLMPHGAGIWIDRVDAIAADGMIEERAVKRRLLPGRYSEILSFGKRMRSLRITYAALPFSDEEVTLAVHVMQD